MGMRHDLLSDILYVMNNAEKRGKKSCTVPASSVAKNMLMVLQRHGYVGKFEFIEDRRQGLLSIELVGKINKSRAIRPRFAVKKGEYEKWESRYLPARGFGVLLVSTSKGVMSQKEAADSGLGGRLLGYVY